VTRGNFNVKLPNTRVTRGNFNVKLPNTTGVLRNNLVPNAAVVRNRINLELRRAPKNSEQHEALVTLKELAKTQPVPMEAVQNPVQYVQEVAPPEPPRLVEARREAEQARSSAGASSPVTQQAEEKVREIERVVYKKPNLREIFKKFQTKREPINWNKESLTNNQKLRLKALRNKKVNIPNKVRSGRDLAKFYNEVVRSGKLDAIQKRMRNEFGQVVNTNEARARGSPELKRMLNNVYGAEEEVPNVIGQRRAGWLGKLRRFVPARTPKMNQRALVKNRLEKAGMVQELAKYGLPADEFTKIANTLGTAVLKPNMNFNIFVKNYVQGLVLKRKLKEAGIDIRDPNYLQLVNGLNFNNFQNYIRAVPNMAVLKTKPLTPEEFDRVRGGAPKNRLGVLRQILLNRGTVMGIPVRNLAESERQINSTSTFIPTKGIAFNTVNNETANKRVQMLSKILRMPITNFHKSRIVQLSRGTKYQKLVNDWVKTKDNKNLEKVSAAINKNYADDDAFFDELESAGITRGDKNFKFILGNINIKNLTQNPSRYMPNLKMRFKKVMNKRANNFKKFVNESGFKNDPEVRGTLSGLDEEDKPPTNIVRNRVTKRIKYLQFAKGKFSNEAFGGKE
jgi:hypothetical protein